MICCSHGKHGWWLMIIDGWWLMSNEQGSGSGLGWKPILLVTVGKCDSICPRVTTSISHPPGWKPVPLILWYLVLASSQQSYATITVPRTTSTVTQGIGFQPMQWRCTATFIKLRKFLIIDGVHTENAEDTDVRKRTLWGNVNHRNLNWI